MEPTVDADKENRRVSESRKSIASVFVCAAGLCTALHKPLRIARGSIAWVVRPVTATRRPGRATRAIKISGRKLQADFIP